MNTPPLYALSVCCLFLSCGAADAAVTFTFSEVADDVVASVTGSLTIGSSLAATALTSTGIVGSNTALFGTPDMVNGEQYFNGSGFTSGLTTTPDLYLLAEPFGYDGNVLILPFGESGPTYTPPAGDAFVWENTTLADIGLGSLTTIPTTVWSIPSPTNTDGQIQFVNAVPEPSSVLLAGLGFVALLRRRR